LGLLYRLRKHALAAAVLMAILSASVEAVLQRRDGEYVEARAQAIVREAGATTPQERVIALRDYLRGHVRYEAAAYDGRPFLRATAGETIRSGLGYCGEVTRAFICMAAAVGVPAQRINLYGKKPHVVAEAELGPGWKVIADCQSPPQIAGLERLDEVILRPDYDDYYTLNLRRAGINRIVSRVKLEMGPLTYWTENPHALKATLWLSFAAALLGLHLLRSLTRLILLKRGWVHVSSLLPVVSGDRWEPGVCAAEAGGHTQQPATDAPLRQ
jgi:hypothetical protein